MEERRRAEFYEDFQPSSDWTRDKDSHVLLIDLPGFKKEELKVQVDNLGRVKVSGERQESENKRRRFEQLYEAPQDSDIAKIRGRFDGDILFIIIPIRKSITETAEEPKLDQSQSTANPIDEEKKKDDDQDQELNKTHSKEKAKEEGFVDKEKIEKNKKDEERNKNESKEKAKEKDFYDKEKIEKNKKDEDQDRERVKKEKKRRKSEEKMKKMKENESLYGRTDQREEQREIKEGLDAETFRSKLQGDGAKGRRDLDWGEQELGVLMADAMQKIRNNKNIVITAVFAFSIGFYLSRKFQSKGGGE